MPLMILMVYSCNTVQKITLTQKNFRTGTFEAINGDKSYIIKRDKKYQTEEIFGESGEIKYKINWINNKKYTLVYKSNTLLNKYLSSKYNRIKDTIIIELINVEDDNYYFKSIFKEKVSYDAMKKIN